ncbi:hypothetical protein BGW42_006965 [Actinomortierella wolfii]|nr:hypothetical protein BGW42_006965 [Actinomortierella wolfii]
MRIHVASLAFVLSLSLLPASANNGPSKPNDRGNGFCNTPDCKAMADAILESMNPAVDPCQDFYEFACGGFLQRKEIPPGQNSVSTIDYERSNNITKFILEASPKSLKGIDGKKLDKASLRNLDKIQSIYKMCMDETLLESVGTKPLHDELEQLVTNIFPVQGSPLAQLFVSDSSDPSPPPSTIDRKVLTSAMVYFVKSGIHALFSLSSGEDPVNDPTIQRVIVQETGLTFLSSEAYQVPAMVTALQGSIQQSFSAIFGSNSNVDAAKLAQEVVAFETQLASISTPADERYIVFKLFNPRTIEQLDQMSPIFDWKALLEGSLENDSQNNQNITIYSPAYQERLGKLLAETSPATLQTYFAWKIIKARGTWLSAKYRAPLESLNALASGTDPSTPPQRWKSCVTSITAVMGPLIGYFYVGLEFSEADRLSMIEIIDSLRDSFKTNLPKLDWLDNQTLANAVRKLDAIESLVGWSMADPNVGSPTDLERYFSNVKVNRRNYYSTMASASRTVVANALRRAGKKSQRQRMFPDPQTINAFYHPMTNQVIFPAAFVQPPMYRAGAPEYINYGAIGYIAAHEITHGFDISGRLFDADGLLRDWWTNETATQFNAKAQCMVDQYSRYTYTDPTTNTTYPLNGMLTLGENIADNGGVKYSFRTWQARYNGDRNGKRFNNRVLPGLEKWTRDQMFFVGFGQFLCNKIVPAYELILLQMEPHSPPRWRVNGPLQNMPEFANAFKCASGSPMNPTNRCAVW